MSARCYKCKMPVFDEDGQCHGFDLLDGWACVDCAPDDTDDLWKTSIGNQIQIDLVKDLTDIRDIARSGLPSSGLTVEQSQQFKLNKIAGELTRLIEGLPKE